MNVEYERNLNHAWMILTADEVYKENYHMGMLASNVIPGLLSVRGQGEDDKSVYRYEISGMSSMRTKGESAHWTYSEMQKFVEQFIRMLNTLQNYMLDIDCLILRPEYIFLKEEEYYFCYCPAEKGDIQEGFHELTEYFVRETDYRDQDGIYMACELHKASMEENYSLEQVLERIAAKKEQSGGASVRTVGEKTDRYNVQADSVLDDWGSKNKRYHVKEQRKHLSVREFFEDKMQRFGFASPHN